MDEDTFRKYNKIISNPVKAKEELDYHKVDSIAKLIELNYLAAKNIFDTQEIKIYVKYNISKLT
jgi:hypothetical protein